MFWSKSEQTQNDWLSQEFSQQGSGDPDGLNQQDAPYQSLLWGQAGLKSISHLIQIKLLQQTERSKYIFSESMMKVRVTLHRFWLPSCPHQHCGYEFRAFHLELEEGALAWFWSCLPHISWLSDAIIMPSPWKFRTKREKKVFSPKTQTSPNPLFRNAFQFNFESNWETRNCFFIWQQSHND